MADAVALEIQKVVGLENSVKEHHAGSLQKLQDELHGIPQKMRDKVYQGVVQADKNQSLVNEGRNGLDEPFLDIRADIYKVLPQKSDSTPASDDHSAAALGKRWQNAFDKGNLNDPKLRKDLIAAAQEAFAKNGQRGLIKFEDDLNKAIPAEGAGVQFNHNRLDDTYHMDYVQNAENEQKSSYSLELTAPEEFSPFNKQTDDLAQKFADQIKAGHATPAMLHQLGDVCKALYNKNITDPHQMAQQSLGAIDLDSFLSLINRKAGSKVVRFTGEGLKAKGLDDGLVLEGIGGIR